MQRLIEIQFKQFNKKLLLPKWRRFLSAPLKYIRGKGIEFLASNNLVSAKEVGTQLFTGQSFSVNLPSGLDLYLVGGKSHDSEIRLAHYLITTLSSKDYFLDIGAHLGYFSTLAFHLIGSDKNVLSLEPSNSFVFLDKNINEQKRGKALRLAAGNENGHVDFYQFIPKYAEYNSFNLTQYEGAKWFSLDKYECIKVESVRVDDLLDRLGFKPSLVKIDVEGAEEAVIQGMQCYLREESPTVIMEFSSDKNNNLAHIHADKLLRGLGYVPFIISTSNSLEPIKGNTVSRVYASGLESENIVYSKSNK